MAKLRLAYLINQYPKISHTFIRTEIHALEQLGFDVTRFAVRGWDAEVVDERDRREQDATQYLLRGGAAALARALVFAAVSRPARFLAALAQAVRLSRGGERGLAVHIIYLAEACVLREALRRRKIEHVHAHFGSNATTVALLAHVLTGVTFSFTVHGPEEFDKSLQWKLREKIRCAAFVVAITSYCRAQLYRHAEYGDWKKIKVVGCALDPDFLTQRLTPVPDTAQFVCVGRLCEQKGQLLLLEALANVRVRGVVVELVLVGDGEMRGEVERAIARLNLGASVRIAGWQDGAAIRQLLLDSRGFVLPSFAEGLPIVIMEAMALGRLPISTYIAGIPELVVSGETGFLVPAGDVEALAEAIAQMATRDVASLSRMGAQARARVEQDHAPGIQAARLAALFSTTGEH